MGDGAAPAPDPGPVDGDAHARTVLAMWAALSAGDIDRAESYYRPDSIEHFRSPAADQPGTVSNAVRRASRQRVLTAFPGLSADVRQVIVGADGRVVTHTVVTQAHTGPFLGLAPTGQRVEVERIDIYRFEDGLIAEHWGVADELHLFQRLGLVEVPRPVPGGGGGADDAGT